MGQYKNGLKKAWQEFCDFFTTSKNRIKNSNLYYECYTTGKALIAAGFAIHLTYLFALVPLEFKAKERIHDAGVIIEFSKDDKDQKSVSKYDLWTAEKNQEFASGEKEEIAELGSKVTSMSHTLYFLGVVFWIIGIAHWLLRSEPENSKSGLEATVSNQNQP